MQQKLLSIMTCAILGLGLTNTAFADSANSRNLNEPPAINLKLYFETHGITSIPEKRITPTDSFCSGPCSNKIDLSLNLEDPNNIFINITTYADLYYRSSQVIEWVENQQKGLPKSSYPTFKPKELVYAYKFDLKFHWDYYHSEDFICPNLILAQGYNEKYGNNVYLFSNYEKGVAVQNGNTMYETDIVCHPVNDPTRNEIFGVSGNKYDYGSLELMYAPEG